VSLVAIVFKKNGRPISLDIIAAIIGRLMGQFGIEADLVEVPEEKKA
jgi:hypothetical protein